MAQDRPTDADILGSRTESDLGAERGAQEHRPTTGTVGGGTEADREGGGGTGATPGTSGGGDHERMREEES